jgi:hypothetical protein
VLYFTVGLYGYLLAENAEERLFIHLNERPVDRLPQAVFGLENVLQAGVLLQGLTIIVWQAIGRLHLGRAAECVRSTGVHR